MDEDEQDAPGGHAKCKQHSDFVRGSRALLVALRRWHPHIVFELARRQEEKRSC